MICLWHTEKHGTAKLNGQTEAKINRVRKAGMRLESKTTVCKTCFKGEESEKDVPRQKKKKKKITWKAECQEARGAEETANTIRVRGKMNKERRPTLREEFHPNPQDGPSKCGRPFCAFIWLIHVYIVGKVLGKICHHSFNFSWI